MNLSPKYRELGKNGLVVRHDYLQGVQGNENHEGMQSEDIGQFLTDRVIVFLLS